MPNRAERRRQERLKQKQQSRGGASTVSGINDVKRLAEIAAQPLPDGIDMNMHALRMQQDARQKIMQQLERNGITAEDLKVNYDLGYDAGWKRGQEATTEMFFAAICLALYKCFGFGAERCHRVLTEVYQNVVYTIDSADAVKEVFDKIGLKIDLHADIFDPVEEVPKKK